MLIGSRGGAGFCVILEHAALSPVLKQDVLDTSVCAGVCVFAKREKLESVACLVYLSVLSGC